MADSSPNQTRGRGGPEIAFVRRKRVSAIKHLTLACVRMEVAYAELAHTGSDDLRQDINRLQTGVVAVIGRLFVALVEGKNVVRLDLEIERTDPCRLPVRRE